MPRWTFFFTFFLVLLAMIECWLVVDSIGYFMPFTDFLPATVLRAPLRQRALVRVR
jgi:hypothetical protein